MKTHLPLSLRAALLAAFVVVASPMEAQAASYTMPQVSTPTSWSTLDDITYPENYWDKTYVNAKGDLIVKGEESYVNLSNGDAFKANAMVLSNDGGLGMASGGYLKCAGDITVSNYGYIEVWNWSSGDNLPCIEGNVIVKSKGQFEPEGDLLIKGNLTLGSGALVQYSDQGYNDSNYQIGIVYVDGTLTVTSGVKISLDYWYKRGEHANKNYPNPDEGTCLFVCRNYSGDLSKITLQICGCEEYGDMNSDYWDFREHIEKMKMDLVVTRVNGLYVFTLQGKPTIVTQTITGTQTQSVSFGDKESLVFSGKGTLKLKSTNSHVSSTINGATVVATGSKSFGSGQIVLKSGTLDLGGQAVANLVDAQGGTIMNGKKYTGSLLVGGKVALKGDFSAGSVALNSGTLSGGTIVGSEVALADGTISSTLLDCKNITTTGKVTLAGSLDNSTVTVESGALTLAGTFDGVNPTVVVNGGTAKITSSAAAIGYVDLQLYGGTLDLGKKDVIAHIGAFGGTLTGATAHKYDIEVNGAVTLGGVTTAANVELDAGASLSGGSIKDATIYLNGNTTCTSGISGTSKVYVLENGSATLGGKLDYTGDTRISGTLTLNGALKNSSVYVLAGGKLVSNAAISKTVTLSDGGQWVAPSKGLQLAGGQILNINGGKVTGDLTVAAKSTLSVTGKSAVSSNLTLGGGSIMLSDGANLSVSGTLKVDKATTLDASTLTSSATISFASISGKNYDKLISLGMPQGDRKTYDLSIAGKSITVKVGGENADLTWQGAKGKWEVVGSQQWTGTSSDNRFYHGDNVTFASAATVTLATKLVPGSVTVQGGGTVTFSGSGSIAGDGALTMNGTSTLKMNATNTYTGGTTISSGTVIATGVASFGSGDITLSGGTLDLGGKAVANNILVSGSASILKGKAFVGTITTTEGGKLSLSDSLTGTLVLNGGTLDVSGVKNVAKLTFGRVLVKSDTLIVGANGQIYEFRGNKLVDITPRALDEPEQTIDPEPQEAIDCDRTIAAMPVPQHADLPGAGLYTTMMRAQLDGNRAAFDSIRQLMGTGETSSADGRYRFAAQATSASTDMKDYRRQGFGGLVMVEEVFSRKAVGGLSLNYEHADINPDGAGKYESDDTRVNAHLLVSSKNWQSRSIAGIGIHDYDVNRSSATGHSFNLMEEISRTIAVDDKSVVAPFVRVETGYNVIGSINDGVLAIDKQTAWFTDVTLGARFVKTCDFGSVMLEAGVTKAIGDQGGAIGASLVDDPATRAALSPSTRNRWSAVLGGSVQVPMGTRSSLNAGATLRFHGGTTEVNANVGYSIKF